MIADEILNSPCVLLEESADCAGSAAALEANSLVALTTSSPNQNSYNQLAVKMISKSSSLKTRFLVADKISAVIRLTL